MPKCRLTSPQIKEKGSKICLHVLSVSVSCLDFTILLMKSSPARYELRTRGPLATYKNPNSIPTVSQCLNLAGVTYSTTFKCFFVGCMYCPKVTQSTPLSRKSVNQNEQH